MLHLAARTVKSVNPQEARRRVLNLYREWLREVPHMIKTFPLDLPSSTIRSRIRREFEKYRHVKGLPIIDNLILRGTQELIETQQKWKQKTHILKFMDDEEKDLELENERLSMRVIASPDDNLPTKTLDKPDHLQTKPISPFLYSFLKSGGPN